MNNLPTYSVKQILEGDSSSDEDDFENTKMNHFPWFKKGYQNIYDDLIQSQKEGDTKNYPQAEQTDRKVKLYQETVNEPRAVRFSHPEKFLVVTSN